MGMPVDLLDTAVIRDVGVHGWRIGSADIRVVLTLEETWQALFELGSEFGLLSPALKSHLRSWLPTVPRPQPRGDGSAPRTEAPSVSGPDPHPLSDVDPWLQRLKLSGVPEDQIPATQLEQFWCEPRDVAVSAWALDTVARVIELPKVIGWPDDGAAIPPWLRDLVVSVNGRALVASTGAVSEWVVVAENDEEAAAYRRSAYNPDVRVGIDRGRNVMIYHVPFDDEEPAVMTFGYPLHSQQDVAELALLGATGRIRMDLLQLDQSGTMQYLGSWYVDLTDDVVAIIGILVQRARDAAMPRMMWWASEQERVLDGAAAAERAAFEALWAVDDVASSAPESPLRTRWDEYLRAQSAAAAAASLGAPIDADLVAATRQRVIAERNRLPRPDHHLAHHHLQRGEAYLVFTYSEDASAQLGVRAVWTTDSGPQGREFDVSEHVHLLAGTHDVNDLCGRLATVLSDLSELISDGVHHVFVNVAGAIYALPFHESLLRVGFDRATYTHTLDVVVPTSRADEPTVTVYGSAGDGPNHLDTLDLELQLVANAWSTTRATALDLSQPGTILHLAGHGHTGPAQSDISLQIDGPQRTPLSATDVLLTRFDTPPALVVLSACSTGAGRYGTLQPMDAVPLDIAFLQRGAGCVISTAAPVNDFIATYFAIILHTELAAHGDIWAAYAFTRRCCANPDLVDEDATLRAKLDALWPNWRSQLAAVPADQRSDWMLYRLSGRPGTFSWQPDTPRHRRRNVRSLP